MTTVGVKTVIPVVVVFRYAIAVRDVQTVQLYVKDVLKNAQTVQKKISVAVVILVLTV